MIHDFFFLRECAPSASYHVLIYDVESGFATALPNSGFICNKCRTIVGPHFNCLNCSFCMAGTKSNRQDSCLKCPAGNTLLCSETLIIFEINNEDVKSCST